MGVPIKYHNGTEWVLIDAGAIVDSNGNRITADNITDHTTDSGIHITLEERTNWNGKINITEKGVANGVTPLDVNGVIPDGYMKKGVANGVASLDGGGQLVQKPYVIGSYSGNSATSRSISLGFAPSLVFVSPINKSQWAAYDFAQFIYSAVVSGGNMLSLTGTNGEINVLIATGTGFTVYQDADASGSSGQIIPMLNWTGWNYTYIAFK